MEIDKEKSTFNRIVFKNIEYPLAIKDLDSISGYYVDVWSKVRKTINNKSYLIKSKKIFYTEEQAKASVALSQLSQLIKTYNGDWVADWSLGNNVNKYCIELFSFDCKEKIFIIEIFNICPKLLSFKSKEIAERFLKNFKELIKEASPLLFGYTFKD